MNKVLLVLKSYFVLIYYLFGYLLFRNTRPFIENIKFYYLSKRFKMKLSNEFISAGFVVDKIVLPDSMKEKTDFLFDSLVEQKEKYTSYVYLPVTERIILKDDLIDITAQVFDKIQKISGCSLKLHWLVVNRLKISNKFDEDSTHWHSDNCPYSSIKCMVLLDDVNYVEDGAFQIFSRRIESLKVVELGFLPDHPFITRTELSARINRSKYSAMSEYIVGKKGTIIVFDNNLLHMGNIPRTFPRDTILMQFYPSSENDLNFIIEDKSEITTAPLI